MNRRCAAWAFVCVWIWPWVVWAGSYDDFFIAVKRDDAAQVVELLQRGFDPNTLDASGQHALYLALREPSLAVARVLLQWPKTHVDARNAQEETPLMLACLKGHQEMVKLLLARDADVNKTGWTPLHYAATGGHTQIMQWLLDEHAYIDAESPNGTTPLMMAAQYGSAAAVQLLLDAGADANVRNQLKLSAIDFAHRSGRTDVADLIASVQRRTRSTGQW